MHFFIKKNQLNDAINHVSKAVSTKTSIQILTGIKFEVDEESLIITGSDSEITVQITLPAKREDDEVVRIVSPGKIVLPKYIVDIAKKLPNDEIEFILTENFTVIIKSGSSEFRLNGYDAEEYPDLPQINNDRTFSIQSDLLRSMIRQTIFAVSSLESRPILTGVLWHLEKNILKFVATDSHRLAVRQASVDNTADLSFNNIVVPGKSLNELSKIIDEDNSKIDIIVTENQILIKKNKILFLSRILDGTYPDISRIIPKEGKTQLSLDTKQLLDAIERASLIAKDVKNNIVKLTTLTDSQLEISSNYPEVGKLTETIFVNNLIGEPVKISFNAKYALDALRATDSQEILIDFTGALSPFVIKPIDHDKMLHLILPVRTY